jgi:HPt (histidine-containing phosphotransfer) domain-containing protein
MKGDRERLLAAGMDGYVSKPIRPRELYEAVEGLGEGVGPGEGKAAAPTDAVIDWEGALERAGGSPKIRARLAEVFLREAPALVRAIREAKDAESLRRNAHTIKSSLDLFGAAVARATAFRLEELGRDGKVAEAGTAAAELDAQVAEVARAIAASNGGTP